MKAPDDFGLAYIDQTDPTNYPHARFKDDPGTSEGSVILAAIVNNLYYAMLSILDAAGIVPDGNTETSLAGSSPVVQFLDAMKAVADAQAALQAADYAMRESDELAYTGALPTTWTPLDLSSIVGRNRTFVHLKLVGDTSARVVFRPYGQTQPISIGSTSGPQGTSGASINSSGDSAFISVVTDEDGNLEWLSTAAGSGASTVRVVAFQGLIGPSGGSALYSAAVSDYASLPVAPMDLTRRYIRAFKYTATYNAGTGKWYNEMGGEVSAEG